MIEQQFPVYTVTDPRAITVPSAKSASFTLFAFFSFQYCQSCFPTLSTVFEAVKDRVFIPSKKYHLVVIRRINTCQTEKGDAELLVLST